MTDAVDLESFGLHQLLVLITLRRMSTEQGLPVKGSFWGQPA